MSSLIQQLYFNILELPLQNQRKKNTPELKGIWKLCRFIWFLKVSWNYPTSWWIFEIFAEWLRFWSKRRVSRFPKKRLFDVIYRFSLRKNSAKAVSSGFFYRKNDVCTVICSKDNSVSSNRCSKFLYQYF